MICCDRGQMPRQAEYYADPAAPAANSLTPTAFAATRDSAGRVLLVQRADTGNWELPGGKVELGESVLDAVVREVTEESGVAIKVTGFSGLYTDPAHVMAYVNGEIRQQFAACFHAIPLGGEPRPDQHETVAAAWFSPTALADLVIHPTVRLRLRHAIDHPDEVHIE